MSVLQPRWLLVALLLSVVVGIALAVWLYGTLAAG
jgi:hypothetical protein